jgi:hypothetical protein
MNGDKPLRDVHFVYDAWCRGWEQWAAADPAVAESAAEAFGSAWDDVFTLAEWDLMIEQVPEEGRRYFVRPETDAEVLPPEWTE